MSSLTISVEFITGRCVTATVSDRDEPEWPPHPGRVFMAMAAAYFETRDASDDDDALAAMQWFEALPAPEIQASEAHARSTVKYYVPVNDKLTVNTSVLQSTPGLSRSKQERSYPTTIPIDSTVRFVWTDLNEAPKHIEALKKICSHVIRVGHSSSLVRVWAQLDKPDNKHDLHERIRWSPSSRDSTWHARIVGGGELERLKIACNAESIEQFAELKQDIDSLKGKPQKEAKEAFEKLFGIPYKNNLRVPEPTPATLGLWQGYRHSKTSQESDAVVDGLHFDSELLILARSDGRDMRSIGIQDALALTTRLRAAAMSHCRENPTPAWLGGHNPATGQPTSEPHVAFLALPFVGHQYADGHVMGLAIALPRSSTVSPELRGEMLGPLLFYSTGESREVELKLGKLGEWFLQLEERPEPPNCLNVKTWVGPSRTWASVTPVVLDRFPKSTKGDDRRAWEAEVRQTIIQSCVRAGLPRPIEVDIDTTSWHTGAPRAYAKSRRMRSTDHVSDALYESAKLGDGFPSMSARPGKPSRPQIHVFLRFENLVRGPVLVGTGRFLGYGLCKPVQLEKKRK